MSPGKQNAKTENQSPDKLHATPWEGTQCLIESGLLPPRSMPVWEPACGSGAISRVLEESGYSVVSTDLNDHGYGQTGVDYLSSQPPRARCVITNPPFGQTAEEFIMKGIINSDFLALLLPVDFWNAKRRAELLHFDAPTYFCPLGFRLDWTGAGRPTMNCAWNIWKRGEAGTRMIQLPKPVRRI